MFTENRAFLTFGILCFAVLSSKQILLYNEELLVALSFVGFIVVCFRYISGSISDSFKARQNAIQLEVEESLRLKEEGLCDLLETHKHHLDFLNALQSIRVFTCAEIDALAKLREQTLQTVFSHQVNHKLKTLSGLTQKFQAKLQETVVEGFQPTVLAEFHRNKDALQPQLLDQAFQTLQK
jgi:F0F1-type ATP synthase membrane subunit b/b'